MTSNEALLFFMIGFVLGMIVCCTVDLLLKKQVESEVYETWGKK